MSIARRIEKLEEAIDSGSDAQTAIFWEAHRAAQHAYMRNPAMRKAALRHAEKYQADNSPFKIDTTGMNTEQRSAVLDKAWEADNPWPGFDLLVQSYVDQLTAKGFIENDPRDRDNDPPKLPGGDEI